MFKTTILFNVKKIFNNIFDLLKDLIQEITGQKYIFWFPVFMAVGIFLSFEEFFYHDFYIYLLISFFIVLIPKRVRKILFAVLFGVLIGYQRLYFLSDHKMLDKEINFIKSNGVIEKAELIKNGHRITIATSLGRLKIRSLIKGVPEEVFAPGNKIEFKAKLSPFLDNNIGYNFYKQAFFEKYYAKGVLLAKPVILEKVKRTQLTILLERIRTYINNRISNNFSSDTKGIAEALITGDKGEISSNTKDNYAKSGIAHILAISGLHITLIGGMIFLLLRYVLIFLPLFALRFDIKKISIVVSFFFSMLYVLIAGMRIPSLRALLMYGVIVIAVIIDRTAINLRNVAISAILILMFIPESINNPGFYMSFFVVAALISYYEDRENVDGYFQGIVVSSVIASLSVIPFSWYFFNQVVGNSISANLLSIPILGFIIMPSMICFIFGIDFCSNIAEFGIKLLNLIAEVVKSFDFLFFHVSTPNFFVMGLAILGILILIINKRREVGIPLLFIAFALHFMIPSPFLFLKSDLSVFGVKDGENFYVNDMIKARSSSNLWRQISGAKEKKKLKIIDNEYMSPNYKITNFGERVIIEYDNKQKEIKKSTIQKNMNIIIHK